MNAFEKLYNVNVSDHIEHKNGLSYISWAWAWAEIKKAYPTAFYTIYENKDGWFYHTDGKTAWVKTGVTIEGLEHIEYLPVMDYRNKSIPLERITSFDVNTAIQRSITKACGRHGLALFLYAGEDTNEALPFDRLVTIKHIIVFAKNHGLEKEINEQGYKGEAWEFVPDFKIAYLKDWLDEQAKENQGN